MSWGLHGDENIKFICLRLTFEEIPHTDKYLGVLKGDFYGFGCTERHQDALLAKTMDCHGYTIATTMNVHRV